MGYTIIGLQVLKKLSSFELVLDLTWPYFTNNFWTGHPNQKL
jgi:hypothetical protein